MERTVGRSLLTDGPGLSAFIRFMCEPPCISMKVRRKTSTPIPPIQWVKLRHISMQWGSTSTSFKILAPVVVKPETVSKRASMGLLITPLKRKGSPPIKLSTIQLSATDTKPSFT